jgi:hypothetical protein
MHRSRLGETVPEPIGIGPVQGYELCQDRRAGDETQSQHGGPVRETWCELFPVHYDSGSGADEQPGGASDPLRCDRSTDHARDEERTGKPLVRTNLDCDRDLHTTGLIGVRVPGGGGRGVLHR